MTDPPGRRAGEVSPAAEGWVAALSSALASGYLLSSITATREGLLGRDGAGTVRGFARHRLLEDPFASPGARPHRDRELHRDPPSGEGAGLRSRGRHQRDVLIALGARDATAAGDADRAAAGASRRAATDALLTRTDSALSRRVLREGRSVGRPRLFGTQPA